MGEIATPRLEECEWDPTRGEPALAREPSHAWSEVSLGAKGEWHVCRSCAALPRFKRFRVRKDLKR